MRFREAGLEIASAHRETAHHGNVNYDPENHHLMVKLRQEKSIARRTTYACRGVRRKNG